MSAERDEAAAQQWEEDYDTVTEALRDMRRNINWIVRESFSTSRFELLMLAQASHAIDAIQELRAAPD